MNKINRIGVIANLDKPPAVEVAREAVNYLTGRVPVLLLQGSLAERLGRPELAAEGLPLDENDAVVVFGGDGTILTASQHCAKTRTPMLGVNLGRFGFLTETLPEMLIPALERLIKGHYTTEERLTLSCEILRRKQIVRFEHALNEVVIAHGPLARVMHLATSINGKYITTYLADGVIVATPTGSTAYSLSAGGPLVHPEVSAMLLTPICPHTLMTRSILVPATHVIEVQVKRTDGVYGQVTVDGQRGAPLEQDDTIRVKMAEQPVRLITDIGGADFYEKLQTKLRLGEQITL